MKCEKYWPDVGERKTYGDINVHCMSDERYADFTVTKLTMKKVRQWYSSSTSSSLVVVVVVVVDFVLFSSQSSSSIHFSFSSSYLTSSNDV